MQENDQKIKKMNDQIKGQEICTPLRFYEELVKVFIGPKVLVLGQFCCTMNVKPEKNLITVWHKNAVLTIGITDQSDYSTCHVMARLLIQTVSTKGILLSKIHLPTTVSTKRIFQLNKCWIKRYVKQWIISIFF